MKMKKTQRAVSIFCTGLMLIPTLFSAQPAKACTGNSYSQTYLDIDWINDEEADGYQIQYATDKKFKSAKNITITSWLTESKRISKLKSKKKYYVRIRAYKNSAKGKNYRKWSKVKSCKVK